MRFARILINPLILSLAATLFTTLSYAAPQKPVKIFCEYRVNPLGVDTKSPRLSWVYGTLERNQVQKGYEIVVGQSAVNVQQGKGDVWSSGKINSSQQTNIEYAGPELLPRTRYYWSVRIYDNQGEASLWSEPAWFEMGMISDSAWKSKWIGDGSKHREREEDHYKPDPMPLFRKTFSAQKTVASARLYISGLGYYEAYLNGNKVSDHVLDPGWTTYRKSVLYVVHDVTADIRKGNNVAGIMLGNGWWNPLPFKFFGRWDLRNYQQTERPCVKAEIHILYSDGSSAVIPTDETWQTTVGPVVRNNVYLGEHYDARLELRNWSSGAKGKEVWRNASLAGGPSGSMTVQMQPPIKITKTVKAVRITEPQPGIYIADLGQNFAGVARLKVRGPAGTKITLRYGEGLFKDGSLNVMTTVTTQIKKGGIKGGPGAPETAWQEDSYTLRGGGVEIWSPRFTFHGFRYVEISGWPGKPTLDNIEGLRMNSDLQQQGTFASSNDMFNKLHDVIQWTFLSNVFSVQSDCPAREKMGYGADMVVSANAFIYNYNMTGFYEKAVQDFANEQQPDGGITEIAPYTGIADRGYGGESGPLGWQLGYAFLQKQLYDFYGDRRVIEKNYDGIKRQMDFLKSKAVDGLFHWDISDHESIDPRPEALTASAFYYHHAVLASEFAGILDKKEDSVAYAKLASRIKQLIVRKYLVPGTGRFDIATQGAQIFALYYNLSPEKEKSYQVLNDEFKRHNWHVASGIFGVKMMFDLLRENNDNETAYKVANQRDYPGWGFMLQNDATTLWESWEFPETGPSRNHPMFGSIDEWFYRSLLGINPGSPGFETVMIKPQPAGDLTWAKGSYESVHGKIVSDWKITGSDFNLAVSVPGNTKGLIWIPAKDGGAITERGKSITNGEGIKLLRYENGYAVVETGSGEFTFKSTSYK